ncbi:type II secretion system protein N [Sphingobium aromaticiconvertens]|uniref:type II secretion system protein N n=1 Tax=Sphingobium aromaticiconvertens TaxID=365341 RepID=UPI0030169C7B
MRVPGRERLDGWRLRAVPVNWLSVAEMALLAGVALQAARLIWAVMTPFGPAGPWEGRQAEILAPAAREALFSSFDPFFRGDTPQGGNVVVTSLALTVYGIRLNEGSGLGSAIIATPDGIQNSFAVGDEIMPGVVLKGVAFDHVTIDRGGAEEQVFIDQSTPAPEAPPGAGEVAAVAQSPMAPPPQPPLGSPTSEMLKRDVGFAPRTQNGRVTGLVLQSRGPGFAAAGFQPGDIVTQVNGRVIGSGGDLAVLQNQIAPGARISLMVERGAAVVPIALTLQGQ